MRFGSHIPIRIKDAFAARHEPEARTALARLFWVICVCIGIVFLLLSIAYGTWEFFRSNAQRGGSIDVRPQIQVTKAQLQELLGKFDQRRVRFEERLEAKGVAKDPAK